MKNIVLNLAAIILSLIIISCSKDDNSVNPEPLVQIDSPRFDWTSQELPFGIWRHSIIMTDTDEIFGIRGQSSHNTPNVFRIKSGKMEDYYFPDNVYTCQVVGTRPDNIYVICNDTVPGELQKPHIEKWNGNGFSYLNVPIEQSNGFGSSSIGCCMSSTGEIYMPSWYHNIFIYDGSKIYEIPGPTDSLLIYKIFFDKKNVLKCYSEYEYWVNDTIGTQTTYIFYEYDGNKWNSVFKLESVYENPCFVEIFNSNIGVIYTQGIYELTETNNLVLRLTNNMPYYGFAFPINGVSFDEFLSLGGVNTKDGNKNREKYGTYSILNWNGKNASLEFKHLLNFVFPTSIRYCKGYYCLLKEDNWGDNILYIGRPKIMEQKNQSNSASKNKNY